VYVAGHGADDDDWGFGDDEVASGDGDYNGGGSNGITARDTRWFTDDEEGSGGPPPPPDSDDDYEEDVSTKKNEVRLSLGALAWCTT